MYKLRITTIATRGLKMLSRVHQKAVILGLQEIQEDPLAGKPLTRELTGKFSYRIGVYRIIYKVNQHDKIVTILVIGHRGSVYE